MKKPPHVRMSKFDLVKFFGFSLVVTIGSIIATMFGLGAGAAITVLILIAIEITFSFENAIINARVLEKMSRFWQRMFLTVGIIIAIFGMRVLFPILIVSLTASLGWKEVLDLVLNHPAEYAEKLEQAHPSIAAFGGSFLLMLALYFFFDETRTIHWFGKLERHLQQFERNWLPAVLTIMTVWGISLLPANHHAAQVLNAGIFGVATFIVIELMTQAFARLYGKTEKKARNAAASMTGLAAFSSFIYLEVLDASFSFDGVIGAFAVTTSVILIAAGLGIGAVWVRSLTVFMVRRGTLDHYRYLEHGAHYTVVVLAATLLLSVVVPLPEAVAGAAGIIFIGGSYYSSRRAIQAESQGR